MEVVCNTLTSPHTVATQYTARMVSTLLYTMLPGAWCPDDLVAMGQVNTMLGLVTNKWLPLNFTRNGIGYPGQVGFLGMFIYCAKRYNCKNTCKHLQKKYPSHPQHPTPKT